MTTEELDKRLTEHIQAISQTIEENKNYKTTKVDYKDLCETLSIIKNTFDAFRKDIILFLQENSH